jgi:hypothetical protein
LFLTKATPLFYYIGINVVKLPEYKGYNYLVVAKDDFFKWLKAKLIKNLTSKKIAKFIWIKVICRYNLFRKLKVDSSAKFKGFVIKEL